MSVERGHKETFEPKLNSNKDKLSRSRSNLKSRTEYHQILSQRDDKKLQKVEKHRQESIDKDMKECSFKPNLNHNKSRKASKIRSSMLGLGEKVNQDPNESA